MDATQVAEFEALLELLNYQRLLVDVSRLHNIAPNPDSHEL